MTKIRLYILLATSVLQPQLGFRLVGLGSTGLPSARRSSPVVLFTEEVTRSISIKRSAEACFDAYSQLERIPEWCSMLGQIRVISPSRSEWRPRLPTALAKVLPVIQWTSDQCLNPEECMIEWQSISGVDNSGKAQFEALGLDECCLNLTIRYTVPAWLQPIVTSRPARAFVRSTVNTTVEEFKTIMEAEAETEAADEMAKASARLKVLKAEQRRNAAVASVLAAAEESDISVLEATLEEAEAAGVDSSEHAKAYAIVEAQKIEDERKQTKAEDTVHGDHLQDILPKHASSNRAYTSAVSAEIEITSSAREACDAYSDIEKFPSYVPLLKSVRVVADGKSEWELQLPPLVVRLVRVFGMGRLIKWQATYTVDYPHRLTWQSLSGFENAGVASFESLDDGRCRVVVNMTYSVPLVLKPLESSSWVQRFMSSTMRDAMEAFQLALEADSD